MDKACLECWHSSKYKDSSIIDLKAFKTDAVIEITALKADNTDLKSKLVRTRRFAIIEGTVIIGGVLIVTLVK